MMLDPFDSVYVVNLPSRTDRREQMEEQLRRVGLSFDSSNVHLFPAVRPSDPGGFESIGARGCFMSHLSILKAASGARNVLILEDDLNFAPSLRDIRLPSDWNIFYGGALHTLQTAGELTVVPSNHDIQCSHFVAFNGPMIPRMIDFLEALLRRAPGDPEGGPMHVDGAYNTFRARTPDAITLMAIPELGYQRPSRSDVAPLKWFDKIPALRGAVKAVRALKAL